MEKGNSEEGREGEVAAQKEGRKISLNARANDVSTLLTDR